MLVRGEALPSRGAVELGRLPQAVAWRIRPLLTLGVVAGLAALMVVAPFEIRAGLNNSMIAVLAGTVPGGRHRLCRPGLPRTDECGRDCGLWCRHLLERVGIATRRSRCRWRCSRLPPFGILLSLPSLRTRGASLAVLTLAAAVALQSVVLDRDGWFGSPTSQDASTPSLLGLDLGPSASFPGGDGKIPSASFGLLVLVVTTAGGAVRYPPAGALASASRCWHCVQTSVQPPVWAST